MMTTTGMESQEKLAVRSKNVPNVRRMKMAENVPPGADAPVNSRVRAKLKRLSICACGFPVLKEDIPLGTEYEINPRLLIPCTFICGGCGQHHSVLGVLAEGRTPDVPTGLLPVLIFEDEEA